MRAMRPSLRSCPRRRRGFNLVELLLALAISSALLSATMAALNACFIAYQTTTEEASTHTIARLVMHRVLTMVRTSTEFGPVPDDPLEAVTGSDNIVFRNHSDEKVQIAFNEDDATLTIQIDTGDPRVLLRGVQRTQTADGEDIPAFTLEWDKGTRLYRMTMDISVSTDDTQRTKSDTGTVRPIRLVASSIPRTESW